MIYTVVWLPHAQSILASIWLQATDRNAVTQASHRIEVSLRRSPDTKGQPLEDDLRLIIDDPLMVTFTVSPLDRLVTIIRVETV